MIITGDIAVPAEEHVATLKTSLEKCSLNLDENQHLLCNFEGLIYQTEKTFDEPVLYNHPNVIRSLFSSNSLIAALANNHILDLPGEFDKTLKVFKENDVLYLGAGKTIQEATEPIKVVENGVEVFVLNACWSFLLYNQKNPSKGVYVAEIQEKLLIHAVACLKKENENAKIIVFLHWNFDLETLPFPMHRRFAKALIDAGANVVAGAHSHCVQGGEKYNDGYIVYGLGNFFIPNNIFAGGKIAYPEWTSPELVLDWNPLTNEMKCHWFEYRKHNDKDQLEFIAADNFETSERLQSFSPYQNMDDNAYWEYFKQYRRKSFLIPVFKDYKEYRINKVKVMFLKYRAGFARLLAKKNVIKWQR
ncbi:MAG: CapA family protein [Paludibacter sp.]|nr:CapA family protein [Paludibacter sp.]